MNLINYKSAKQIISIITVCYNAENDLEKTIINILNQDYEFKEFIIVDGGSTDGTIEIIQKYENYINKWISEPDRGIYDAMNKGIEMAEGDVLHFLNSGDFYFNKNVLQIVSKTFLENKRAGLVYGLTESYSESENIKYISGSKIDPGKMWKGMPVCHQSIFFKKDVFNEIGIYDLEFKNMADYELLLRFFNSTSNKYEACFLNMILSRYCLYGESSKGYLENVQELKRVVQKYYDLDLKFKSYFVLKKIKYFFILLLSYFKLDKIYRKIKFRIIGRVKTDG
jgi:glycosyltransferase involved in cell wall biosynthesis